MSLEVWLALVVLLQQQSDRCVAPADRKFLAQMANVLTLDEPPGVEPWQRRWLAALKRECHVIYVPNTGGAHENGKD